MQDFVNIEYEDDGNVVKYDLWLHFEESNTTRNVNEKVKVLNLAPITFWAQTKVTDMPTFSIQGFGQFTFGLRSIFKDTVIGQGVAQQFLGSYSNFALLATSAELSTAAANFVWSDRQYGLNDPNNYEIWVAASRNRLSPDYKILINYFGIEPFQIKVILDQINTWLGVVEGIVDNWFCGSNSETGYNGPCDSEYLTFLQLSSSGVTGGPPPGAASSDSICEQNSTCVGWPEISSYLKHVFPEQYPKAEDCFNLTFTNEEMKRWILPSKEPFCLLHAGNMNYLWEQGRLFDKTLDVEVLLNILQRFQLKTFQHAFVFWNWVKYVTVDFVLKTNKQGTKGIAGIGKIASQAFYGVFSAVQDWIGELLLLSKVADKMGRIYQSCPKFAKEIIGDATEDQIAWVCKNVDLSKPDSLLTLVNVCDYEFGLEWTQLQTNASLTELQMIQLCDRNNPSL